MISYPSIQPKESECRSAHFIYLNRSNYVNVDFIQEFITDGKFLSVLLRDGETVLVSRQRTKTILFLLRFSNLQLSKIHSTSGVSSSE
jgi:DNA-binding LytR/AlgR family response regulator